MALQAEFEAVLAGLPEAPPWIRDAARVSWQRQRQAVGRRHRAWRDGSDSWDHLYEDAEHRVRALAGSLARELGELLEMAVAGAPCERELEVWIRGASHSWVEAVRRHAPRTPDSPVDVAAFVDEFLDRERVRALGRLGAAPPPPSGIMATVVRQLRAALQRALYPGSEGRR